LRRPRHLPTYGQESLESNQCHCAVFQVIKRSDPTDYRAAAMRGDQGSTEAMEWLGIRLIHLGGDGQGRPHPSVQLRQSPAGHHKKYPTSGSLAQYVVVSEPSKPYSGPISLGQTMIRRTNRRETRVAVQSHTKSARFEVFVECGAEQWLASGTGN
jgi:hypothetical protein